MTSVIGLGLKKKKKKKKKKKGNGNKETEIITKQSKLSNELDRSRSTNIKSHLIPSPPKKKQNKTKQNKTKKKTQRVR